MNEFLQQFNVLWQDIIAHPGTSLAIIGNLIIIESLLSVDNAAVLATMVMDLKPDERSKALKYGIWGAYFFRGLAMIFAAALIKIWWLKAVGGLYLIYLVYDWWKGKQTASDGDDLVEKENKWFYRITKGSIGTFWATVVAVEIMDMAFSIDNVFAAVAFTPNIILVCVGVFIGIFAMRFIAQWFVRLMEKYPFLETCAFVVIAILGFKLVSSAYSHFYPCSGFATFMEGDTECLRHQNLPLPAVHKMPLGDIITSILTVSIFFIPILTSIFFKYPKKNTVE